MMKSKVKSFGKRAGQSSYPTVGFTALSEDDSTGSFCIVDEDDGDVDDRDIELGMIRKEDHGTGDQINGKIIKKNIDQYDQSIPGTACLLVESGTDKGSTVIQEEKPHNFNEMVANSKIQFLAIFYSFFSFSVMFVDECFPLWAVTSIQKGGLSWNTGQVGSALVGVGESTHIFDTADLHL